MQQESGTHMMPFSSLGLPGLVLQQARHMSARFDNYMRVVDLRRMAHINCGATQESIESHTFPHKYKRVSRQINIKVGKFYHDNYICIMILTDEKS